MKYKYGDRIKVVKGFNTGRTGKIVGNGIFFVEVLFDNQYAMTDTILKNKIEKIEN